MQLTLIITNCLLALALIWYAAINTIKQRNISGRIEDILLEQDKMKFRLFVAEKKQAVYYQDFSEKKAV